MNQHCTRADGVPWSCRQYLERVQTLEGKSADVYRYMNFNKIAEFQEVADTVTV